MTEPTLAPGESLESGLIVATSDRGWATFSPDRRYRYSLERWLTPRADIEDRDEDRLVTFIMLNPSTADAFADDPTIRKCIGFARGLGADTMRVHNLHALRAPDPRELYKLAADQTGSNEVNYLAMLAGALAATHVICAWGTHGKLRQRHGHVKARLRAAGVKLHHLGLTKDGYPKHPLYLASATPLTPWEAG